ncbi:hypothetical protein [Glaesserella parasuis]|uniref:hypothetical protein n=1 Tax=Glaesserella parasuis TaxID=738 RepID=UPI002436B430|nr:hypothetical protein [Glaesserella parasuis]MDG6809491.1 hypothetical protein [Glaesserella parasuis]
MKKKYLFQLAQDLILTAILLSLFGYHLYEEITQEWLGLVFFALIISHLSLNTWWLKKLFSGSYNGYRILQSAVNDVKDYVMYYNHIRPHSYNQGLPPILAEKTYRGLLN